MLKNLNLKDIGRITIVNCIQEVYCRAFSTHVG